MDEFCKQCAKHKVPRRPKHPKKLTSTINMLKVCVGNGELIETIDSNDPYYSNFAEINSRGPWPDIIRCVFKCSNCGNTFELSAMTYTGTSSNRFGYVPQNS